MSDEKTSQLNINIGKRVRYYVIYFVIVILFLIWGNDIINLITASLAIDSQKSGWAQQLIASLITALGAGALLILNLGRDIDLHNNIDKAFFHVRHNTGTIIQREMKNAAQRVGANGWRKMENNQPEVMRLFYHFVNNQEVLRSLAFTYWEQYFVNIYIIFFGTIGFLISLVVVLIRWRLDVITFAPLVFLLIVGLVAASTRYSLIPKMYSLPIQQIEDIYNSNSDEFKKQVEARFGGIIVP